MRMRVNMMHMAHVHVTKSLLQAEVVTKLFTFADACAHPSAKRITLHGRTGPVNAVEVDGTLFIQNDEAKAAAEAEALCSKALELASEVAVASKAAAAEEAAAEVALDSEPCCSGVETFSAPAVHRISYATAASKPPVGPKPSARCSIAASKFPAGLKRSTPASQPPVVVTPLEVRICIMGAHVHICTATCALSACL